MSQVTPDLCIVVPACNEEKNLPLLFGELSAALQRAQIGFQVLFVDDGSRDRTADVARELAAAHTNVRAILLSRNFGHQAAVSIGLRYAQGRAIAVMDAAALSRDDPRDYGLEAVLALLGGGLP